jgi:hypothetical protein
MSKYAFAAAAALSALIASSAAMATDARSFCWAFFNWYNQNHHHLDIGLMTPDQVHYGQAKLFQATRQKTLDYAFRANPIRFVNKAPEPPPMPTAVWINPPAQKLKVQA